jgi:hypothetical protein
MATTRTARTIHHTWSEDGNFRRAFRGSVTVPNPAKAADGGRQTGRAS